VVVGEELQEVYERIRLREAEEYVEDIDEAANNS
jgi:hypothetical protein